MLTGNLNFCVTFSFYQPTNNRQKCGIEVKTKWCLEVKNITNTENVPLKGHQAPVAQWTSVLDF